MKIKTSLTFIFLCLGQFIFAQNVSYDSLHRPRNFHIKVDQFRSYPDAKNDIIFLGNSITAGTNWNELLKLPQAKNRGISGDTTFGILERLDEVTEGEPEKIFILIGINDIARNYPDEVIISNYKKIISRILNESPRTEIYIQSILPVNNTFTQYKNHYNKDEHILAVNSALKKLSDRPKVHFIDIHPHFLDDQKRLDKKFTEEGLHLNAKAYTHWAEIIRKYI